MKNLKIIWTEDSTDCETCGGNYAQGFRAYLDGVLIDEFEAVASCCDNQSMEYGEAIERILLKLGIFLVEENED